MLDIIMENFTFTVSSVAYIYVHLMYWTVTTTFCDHYNIGLQVMSPYTYEEKCAGPFPDAWTRYVYCQRVVAPPISIFTDTIDGKIKIV